MSGGSMDYLYSRVREYSDSANDPEITELMDDLADVLHEMEWWHSCDIGEEQYREAVRKFKDKWFGISREIRLREYIDNELAAVKDKLYNLIG